MPYSVWAIEDLEAGLQIMATSGIADVLEGKILSEDKRQWDWHGYLVDRYPRAFPAKKLFEDEYESMFSELYRAQAA